MYESQYAYIKRNQEKYNKYARDYYYRVQADPEKKAARDAKRQIWYEANKESVLTKQRETKRQRKLDAIEYLGGQCKDCEQEFHPAIYEFHHRDPETKDRDPSKLLGLKWTSVVAELDKCDLLCANCHRMRHHTWESQ